MFQQQKGLVDPTEVPLPIGLSWVMKFKTDNKKHTKNKHGYVGNQIQIRFKRIYLFHTC